MHTWLLPEYIADILPAEARLVEERRRALLDLFHVHGYQLVSPPLIEFVESLVTDDQLDLRTFKITDQLSGRQMGLRADVAPQVARIDAHLLNLNGVVRLCYAASVVHTLPGSLLGSREQLQVGAEIYGHTGVEADAEVIGLLLDALAGLGVNRAQLDIGHLGIFRSLMGEFAVSAELQSQLFEALQAKDAASTDALLQQLPAEQAQVLKQLSQLHGGFEVLQRARECLPALPEILAALADLESVGKQVSGKGAELYFDLVELRGAEYHSGLVFAAYAPGWPNSIARGGRYDDVGSKFGRARPATGFSFDLRELIGGLSLPDAPKAVLAPCQPEDADLAAAVSALRQRGEVVIVNLPGHAAAVSELNCDRALTQVDGQWVVLPLQ